MLLAEVVHVPLTLASDGIRKDGDPKVPLSASLGIPARCGKWISVGPLMAELAIEMLMFPHLCWKTRGPEGNSWGLIGKTLAGGWWILTKFVHSYRPKWRKPLPHRTLFLAPTISQNRIEGSKAVEDH